MPFSGTVLTLLFNTVNTSPVPPSRRKPGVDTALEVICLRALAKKPEERYPSLTVFAEELAAAGGFSISDAMPRTAQPTIPNGAGGLPSLPPTVSLASDDRPAASKPLPVNALERSLLLLILAALLSAGGYGLYRVWANKQDGQANGAGSTEPKPKTIPDDPTKNPYRLEVTLKTSKKLVIDLVRIPKGKFLMGSSKSEREDLKKRYDYEPKDEDEHEVEITRDYWLGKTTIMRGQFRAFVEDDGYVTEAEKDGEGGWGYDEATGKLEGRKPKYTWKFTGWGMDDKNLDDHPVVNVTWNDADAYCKWLKRKTGREVRLPTEAEWERACRGGERKGRYHFGDDEEDLAKYGNVADASFKKKFPDWTWTIKADDGFVFTAPVKSFRPNQYGLYDMHGNVWQWCNDRYGADYYGKGDRTDPQGPDDGSYRVYRGGGWGTNPQCCRAAAAAGTRRRAATATSASAWQFPSGSQAGEQSPGGRAGRQAEPERRR